MYDSPSHGYRRASPLNEGAENVAISGVSYLHNIIGVEIATSLRTWQ